MTSTPVELEAPAIAAYQDGEREVELLPGQQVEVRLSPDGPLVVDVDKTMQLTATV